MVERLLTSQLIAALDRFIEEQYPGITRYDALKLALADWAIAQGYVEQSADIKLPQKRMRKPNEADRRAAAELLDKLIANENVRSNGGRPPED